MGKIEGPPRPSVGERIRVKIDMVGRATTLAEVEIVDKSLKQDLAELRASRIKPSTNTPLQK